MNVPAINPEHDVELYAIGTAMKEARLPVAFISSAVRTAGEFSGVYGLMKLWQQTQDAQERVEIVADIQDMIDDCAQKSKETAAYVRAEDLEAIAKNITKFKATLLATVEEHGGVTKVAKLTGIPQPSLSRFFNSAAMPRRRTLNKIAQALGLDASKIAIEWTR